MLHATESSKRANAMTSAAVRTLLDDLRLLDDGRHETVEAVRRQVAALVRPLSEEVKYGGIMFSSGVHFGGVFAYKDHVTVEFANGAAIDDPHGLLEGAGKRRRHLKLHSAADVVDRRLADYLPLALAAAQAGG